MLMGKAAKLRISPSDVVFIVYAKLDGDYDEVRTTHGGIITHWSTVEVDVNDNMLPRDAEKRFLKRLW